LKEINPPKGVQEAMNNVVVANNQKIAAIDFATATETKADGEKRAKIDFGTLIWPISEL
jgi:regulator of protease activity HflC (stomatin/prohibitin superfamily)